ncbi:MAG: hypothetical protein H7833_09080 [Magnetococcus sp. DMHC-1]|nr:hypothetical protein [Magnetococcales bacterium]
MNRKIKIILVLCAAMHIYGDAIAKEANENVYFNVHDVMKYYRLLCNMDSVGGAAVGDCFQTQAKLVNDKYNLLYTNMVNKNADLCEHQKKQIAQAKKSYENYTQQFCSSTNTDGNTFGYVSGQYCRLQRAIEGYQNFYEFFSFMEKARKCK